MSERISLATLIYTLEIVREHNDAVTDANYHTLVGRCAALCARILVREMQLVTVAVSARVGCAHSAWNNKS